MTNRAKGVECKSYLSYAQLKYGNISESEYPNIPETVWCCRTCKEQQEIGRALGGVKIFQSYVNGIAKTVRGNPGVVLEASNELHPNLQFALEESDINLELAFLELIVYSDSQKLVKKGWSQKATDTDTLAHFRGCALLQYKINVI